jgi:arsenate reductase
MLYSVDDFVYPVEIPSWYFSTTPNLKSLMPNQLITLYGIKNCDSVKKARNWLDDRQLTYNFHDYRSDGLDADLLQIFADKLGVDAILNQRSTTWRQLDASQKSDLTDEKILRLLLDNPTLIKRPILRIDEDYYVGFSPDLYATHL